MKDKLENLTNYSYAEFKKFFFKELNKHAPLKKKILRHINNAFMTKELRKEITLRSKLKNNSNKERNHINAFMTKELRKEIMLRSKLKNNKERNHINWCDSNRQRNRCLIIFCKTKT